MEILLNWLLQGVCWCWIKRHQLSAEFIQPFTPQLFKTHQKIQFTANIKGLNTFSAAQQVKVVILQNNRWDNASKDIAPTFVRGNSLEYNYGK